MVYNKRQEELSPCSMKKLNIRQNRKINVNHCRGIKRKELKDAGRVHRTQKGKQINAKCSSEQVSGIMLYCFDFRTFSRKVISCWYVWNSII
jgi:hypothetical protein